MKTLLSVHRVALLALALGTASVTASFADDSTTSTTPPTCSGGGCHRHHDSVLTAAEKAELKAARETAFANNPSLKQQFEALKGNSSATKADWQTLKAQVRADELTVDGNLAPIFAKLAAAHHHSA